MKEIQQVQKMAQSVNAIIDEDAEVLYPQSNGEQEIEGHFYHLLDLQKAQYQGKTLAQIPVPN